MIRSAVRFRRAQTICVSSSPLSFPSQKLCSSSLFWCLCSFALLRLGFIPQVGKPAEVSLSKIKPFNPRRLPMCCNNQRTQTQYLSLEDEPGVLRRICVGVCVQESQSEAARLQKQKEELCAQIRDLSLPVDLASESLPDLKKQLRQLESQAGERAEEITALTGKIQQQQQVLTETRSDVCVRTTLARSLAAVVLNSASLPSDRST